MTKVLAETVIAFRLGNGADDKMESKAGGNSLNEDLGRLVQLEY